MCHGFLCRDWIVWVTHTYKKANRLGDGLINFVFTLPLGFHNNCCGEYYRRWCLGISSLETYSYVIFLLVSVYLREILYSHQLKKKKLWVFNSKPINNKMSGLYSYFIYYSNIFSFFWYMIFLFKKNHKSTHLLKTSIPFLYIMQISFHLISIFLFKKTHKSTQLLRLSIPKNTLNCFLIHNLNQL